LFVEGVTGRSFAEVSADDLTDDLPAPARELAVSAINGKAPRSLDAIVAALGSGSYHALRLLASEAPRLWWPPAPAPVLPVAVADAVVADAVVADALADDVATDEIATVDVL